MHPLRCVGIYFIKSKSICADPQDSSPRNLTLFGRRRATGKGKGCVLSSAKISLLFRTVVIFDEKCFYFPISRTEKQKYGTFFRTAPCFSHRPPLFRFLLPKLRTFVAGALLGAPSRGSHARGDAHPRLAHPASFHFFAFTPHLQSIELLNVRGEGFCISSIFTGG